MGSCSLPFTLDLKLNSLLHDRALRQVVDRVASEQRPQGIFRRQDDVAARDGNIVTMPEPVTKWQKVGGNSEYNLLQRFYESPHR